MIVQDYIETFILEHDCSQDASVLLKWINLVESNLDIKKAYVNKYYSRLLNGYNVSLPSGVEFENVFKVFVGGRKYKKKDARAYNEYYTYWYEDGKVCFYPAFAEIDLSYVSGSGELTFSTNTISTTGDDFGFCVGDVVNVSGCTLHTANNKTARIISTAENILTFADGTFTAGLETGIVNISKAGIKLTYEYVPTIKLIANIATDTLMLPDRFQEIYDYFLMSKIAYLAKDYNDSQNHIMMHNAAVARYDEWWENHRPE